MARSRVASVARPVVIVLAACLTLSSIPIAATDDPGPTDLWIVSTPDGAAVFVDGRPAGATPVKIPYAALGIHRVKIVKSGYLENLQSVIVRSSRPTRLNVNLTPSSTPTNQDPSQTQPTGDGLSKKWIWIGLAGGAAAAAVVLLSRNHAPEPGTILVTPNATGMAGQTSFTFQSTASDPDKDPLTFTWNFGDGGSGSGNSATHTFAAAGAFQVQVTISDGKQTVTAPSATVTVGQNLTGTWTGGTILMPDATGSITVNCGLTLGLTQNGTNLTGTMSFAGGCTGGPGSLASGSANALTHPSAVSVASGPFPFPGGPLSQGLVISFSGSTSSAGTTLSGNVTLSNPSVGFVRTTSTSFTKQ